MVNLDLHSCTTRTSTLQWHVRVVLFSFIDQLQTSPKIFNFEEDHIFPFFALDGRQCYPCSQVPKLGLISICIR
jgi:hypothetical protein